MQSSFAQDSHRWNRFVVGAGIFLGIGLGYYFSHSPAASPSREAPVKVTVNSSSGDAAEIVALREERNALERRLEELEAARLQETLTELAELATPAPPTHSNPVAAKVSTDVASAVSSTAGISATEPSSTWGKSSLNYWNRLNDVMSREAEMRRPPAQITADNAASFLSSRGTAGRFAAEAIRELDQTQVDPEIVSLGREIAEWYERGITLNDRAGQLLGSTETARRGAPGQAWRGGEEQHRKQCEDLNRRGAKLRERMTQKYKLPFPALQ